MNLPFVELNLLKVLIPAPLFSESLRTKHFHQLFVDLLDTSPGLEDKNDHALILLLITLFSLGPIFQRLSKFLFVVFAGVNLSAIALILVSNPNHGGLTRRKRLLFILHDFVA